MPPALASPTAQPAGPRPLPSSPAVTARPAISSTCAANIVSGTATAVRIDRTSAPEEFAAISPKTPAAPDPSRPAGNSSPASIGTVKQDERAPFVSALQRARVAAYEPGEFVEQESFMRAGEIRALARQAGIAPGVSVLDLCCGIGGPGRFIAKETGCNYLGVDYSADAIDIARERAADLPCRFEVSRIPPIPPGQFDVVILLEPLLASPDKGPLLEKIPDALPAGGRFACTFEAGLPLT